MLLLLSAPKISGCISEHGRSIPLADIRLDVIRWPQPPNLHGGRLGQLIRRKPIWILASLLCLALAAAAATLLRACWKYFKQGDKVLIESEGKLHEKEYKDGKQL